MNPEELRELVQSIRNRCDITTILLELGDNNVSSDYPLHLLPTILKDLLEDAQTIVAEYCIKEE